jgi:hypothetical protein
MAGRQSIRYGIGGAFLVLALWTMPAALGQTCIVSASEKAVDAQDISSCAKTAVSEKDDSWTGDRWLLVPNPAHPEGPGRWVRAAGFSLSHEPAHPTGSAAEKMLARDAAQPLVIHPGDRVVLEEHSTVADACLEAVALSAAASGGELKARLEIGGRMVRALALGHGRVVLVPESGSAR